MGFLSKTFLITLAFIFTFAIPRSTELKTHRDERPREIDVGVSVFTLLERTRSTLRKDEAIFQSGQVMNFEQSKEQEPVDEVEARFTPFDLAVADLDNTAWETARPVSIRRYWTGEEAPVGRRAEARLLWSDKALYVRFVYQQTEPAVVSSQPQTKRKTIGLWERDVCELFITPNVREPERYFEFEAAPTGEWLDLKIHQQPEERETDWKFNSGMTTAHRLTPGKVMIAIRVPWKALGGKPLDGERWRGNLFRVAGSGTTRGYVTWRPTLTPEPNFHVPTAFGWIRFTTQE